MPLSIARHIVVAMGALSALLALLAVFDQAWEVVYAWLGVGLAMECAEGSISATEPELAPPSVPPIALVAFLNSVFVPVVVLVHAGFLAGEFGVAMAILAVWSAQYRLTFHDWAGMPANFLGFPAAWSTVAFYLHAFDATPPAAVLSVGLAIIAALVPVRWPHPLRSERWPDLTRAVLLIWFATSALTLWHGFPALPPAKAVFLFAAAYAALLVGMAARVRA